MVKLILTGLWVCVVTLGAVYFSVKAAAPPPPLDEEAQRLASMQVVKGEVINVPLLANGAVNGYFITRISFLMDKEKMHVVAQMPLTEMMTDELYTLLVGNKMIDLANTKAFQLDAFKQKIKEGLNQKMGEGTVADVMVEQIDYLGKDDIRDNTTRSAKNQVAPTKIVEGTPVAAPAAASGH